REGGGVGRLLGWGGAVLQIQQERPAGKVAAVRALAIGGAGNVGHQRNVGERAVGTLRRGWSKSDPHRARRGEVHESGDAVKDIAARKEAAEDLLVVSVQPLAAELESVLSADNRNAVSEIMAVKQLVHRGLQEKRLAKAEIGGKAHGCVGNRVEIHGRARAGFPGVGKMRV